MKRSTALGVPLASVPTSHHSSKPMGTGCHHHHWDLLQGGKGQKPGPSLPLHTCLSRLWATKEGSLQCCEGNDDPCQIFVLLSVHRDKPRTLARGFPWAPEMRTWAPARVPLPGWEALPIPRLPVATVVTATFYSHPSLFKLGLSDRAPAPVFCWQRFSWSIIPFVLPALHFFIYVYKFKNNRLAVR